jgi:uncharacterized membrane protein
MTGTRRYAERVSAIGQAGVDLLKAETTVLADELRLTTRTVGRALALAALAAFLAFWALAVFVYLGVEVGSLWMPRWLATVVVLTVLVIATLIVVLLARRSLRRAETPVAIVRRRVEDHRDWWHARLGRRPRNDADDS